MYGLRMRKTVGRHWAVPAVSAGALLLLSGCAGTALGRLDVLPEVECLGKAVIALGPYAGTIDCGPGFYYKKPVSK